MLKSTTSYPRSRMSPGQICGQLRLDEELECYTALNRWCRSPVRLEQPANLFDSRSDKSPGFEEVRNETWDKWWKLVPCSQSSMRATEWWLNNGNRPKNSQVSESKSPPPPDRNWARHFLHVNTCMRVTCTKMFTVDLVDVSGLNEKKLATLLYLLVLATCS